MHVRKTKWLIQLNEITKDIINEEGNELKEVGINKDIVNLRIITKNFNKRENVCWTRYSTVNTTQQCRMC